MNNNRNNSQRRTVQRSDVCRYFFGQAERFAARQTAQARHVSCVQLL